MDRKKVEEGKRGEKYRVFFFFFIFSIFIFFTKYTKKYLFVFVFLIYSKSLIKQKGIKKRVI
jgi:hypothetical protein